MDIVEKSLMQYFLDEKYKNPMDDIVSVQLWSDSKEVRKNKMTTFIKSNNTCHLVEQYQDCIID